MSAGFQAAHNQPGQGSAASGGQPHFWETPRGKAAVDGILRQIDKLQEAQTPGVTTRISEALWYVLQLTQPTRFRLLNLTEEVLLGLLSSATTYINNKAKKRRRQNNRKREHPIQPSCL